MARVLPLARSWSLRHLAAATGYLLLALLLVAPVLPALTAAIPGGPIAAVDGWQNVWNLWWIEQAVAAGQSPFVTDMLFFPQGVGLHLQTLGAAIGLLALPVTATWGPVAAYNIALVAGLALSGLAAYALALRVCGDARASFLAGALFLCSPYLLTRAYDGQLELVSLYWPVLYVLVLLRVLEGGGRREAVVAGLLLALTGLTSWYYLLFMVLFSVGLLLLWPPRDRAALVALVGRLALLGLAAGALLLPVLGPALAAALADVEPVARPDRDEVIARSANLVDFWLPSYLHPLWGEAIFTRVSASWHNYRGDWNAALGYTTIGLACLGAWRAWARSWRWLALAAGALLLALGPELQVGTWRSGIPLPYSLIEQIPGLALGRRPALFVSMAAVVLVPPVALGLHALRVGLARRPWLWVLPVALAALELTPRPLPLQPAAVHPVYAGMAGEVGAVLEVPPAAYKYVEPQRAQLVHERPILGGYLARQPRYRWPNDAPAVRPLWKMRPEGGAVFLAGSDGPLAALSFYGVSAVVVRWDQIEPERREAVEQALAEALPGVAPTYADEGFSLYRVPVVAPRPIAAFSGDWGRPEGDGAGSWRWMGPQGDLTLINPGPALRRFSLELAASSYRRPREVTFSLNGAPAGRWSVTPELTRVRLQLWLPPGMHRLTLAAPAEREQVRGSSRLLSIALREAILVAADP